MMTPSLLFVIAMMFAMEVWSSSFTHPSSFLVSFVKEKLKYGSFGCKQYLIILGSSQNMHRIGRNVPKWRTTVLVFNCNSEKIKLGETCFLRYYKGDEYVRPHSQVSHRDEFLSCTACYKVRRFELRTRDACRTDHDAAARDMIPSNEVHQLHLKLEFGYLIF
ncbi:putative developmental regulator, ULTRAPETALA [Helianthus debilis subsp. tardiflorus]